MTKTRPFLSTCYGYPSTTEVPPCCQAATKKLTFSTTSVLLLLNVPLSLSRGTVFRRPKNPRRGYRPKIAGILFVCNEPEGKYYTVPRHSGGCIAQSVPEQTRLPHAALNHTRVASHLARSDTVALLALWLAFPVVTPPPHYYDAPSTNGNAPRVSLADPTCQP